MGLSWYFTWLNKFSIGLRSVGLVVIANTAIFFSSIIQKAFLELWKGQPSWRILGLEPSIPFNTWYFCLCQLPIVTPDHHLLKRNTHHNSPFVCHTHHEYYIIFTFFVFLRCAAKLETLPNGHLLFLLQTFCMLIWVGFVLKSNPIHIHGDFSLPKILWQQVLLNCLSIPSMSHFYILFQEHLSLVCCDDCILGYFFM